MLKHSRSLEKARKNPAAEQSATGPLWDSIMTFLFYTEVIHLSNEELVAEIQAGTTERMVDLWEQLDGLVKQQTQKVISALVRRGNPCGVEFEDLYQTGYLALDEAVKTYKPGGMSFAAWLMFYLKSAFAAVTGYNTATRQHEPLNNALSLDMPPTDDTDGLALGDCIEDPRAADEITETVEELWNEQLSGAVAEALDAIPELRANILRLRYFEDLTLEEIRHRLGMSRDRVTMEERRGLRDLRTDKLRPFYEFDYYGGTGLTAYRNSGTSVQERYLLELERKSRKAVEPKRKP